MLSGTTGWMMGARPKEGMAYSIYWANRVDMLVGAELVLGVRWIRGGKDTYHRSRLINSSIVNVLLELAELVDFHCGVKGASVKDMSPL